MRPELIQSEPGVVSCTLCGWSKCTTMAPERVRHKCETRKSAEAKPKEPPPTPEEQAAWDAARDRIIELTQEPNLFEKGKHYGIALKRWAKAGCPARTDEEVVAILETCQACDKWNPEKTRCRICGCRVSLGRWSVRNKARMATEHCPLQSPKW